MVEPEVAHHKALLEQAESFGGLESFLRELESKENVELGHQTIADHFLYAVVELNDLGMVRAVATALLDESLDLPCIFIELINYGLNLRSYCKFYIWAIFVFIFF